jgi:hypothetical protein
VLVLNWKPTVNGKVVDPFEVVGAVIVLFSVFVHVIVCATPVASKIRTMTSCPSVALVVVNVMVRVAAELFVTVFIFEVIGTVAAFPEAVIALLVVSTCVNVCVPVNVWAASVRATEALVEGNVIVVESVPARVILLETDKVFAFVTVKVPVEEVIVSPLILVAVAAPKVGVINVGEVVRETAPVPFTAVIPVPFILKTFPVPAVSYVLFVKVSVPEGVV